MESETEKGTGLRLGTGPDAPRVTRRMVVGVHYLESVLRGELRQVIATNAPGDLRVESGKFAEVVPADGGAARYEAGFPPTRILELYVSSSAWPESAAGSVFTPIYHDGGPVRLTTKAGSGGLAFPE